MKVEQERKKAILVQEAAKEKVPKPDICVQFYWDYPYSAGFLESETVASKKMGLKQCSIYWEPRHWELLFFIIVPAFYFHWNKCFCETRWSKSLRNTLFILRKDKIQILIVLTFWFMNALGFIFWSSLFSLLTLQALLLLNSCSGFHMVVCNVLHAFQLKSQVTEWSSRVSNFVPAD